MVLITGANGYVGTNLVDTLRLSRSDIKILCLVRNGTSALESEGVSTTIGDVVNFKSIRKEFENVTTVIHLAATISPRSVDDFNQVNHQGTKNVIRAMKECGVQKIIYLSSYDVASDIRTIYGTSKLMAEKEIINSGLDYVILRPTVIYGGKKDPSFSKIAKYIKKFPIVPVIGGGEKLLQPVFIADLVKIIIISLDGRHTNLVVDIAGPDRISMREACIAIADILKKRVFIINLPRSLIELVVRLVYNSNNRSIYLDKVMLLSSDKITDASEMKNTFPFVMTRFSKGIKTLLNS